MSLNFYTKCVYLLFAFIVMFIIYIFGNTFISNISEPLLEYYENNPLFQKLMKDFSVIFPDKNRNAGGAQFYHHIVENIKPTKMEFLEYNKFYCGVSGSPISPDRTDATDYLIVDDVNGNTLYGLFYRCCSPCVCDIMKYAKAELHTVDLADGSFTHYVLTIGDPCVSQSNIPDDVTSFTCQNGITKNGLRTTSGRLIIGMLYNVKPYDPETLDVSQVMNICQERMSTEPDKLQGGMGDIFVKLSLINP